MGRSEGQLDPERVDENWETLLAHIKARFDKRFLEPADILLKHEDEEIRQGSLPEGLGFSVLAIDCLLIETICGYENGAPTPMRGTSQAFETFLTTAPRFEKAFAQESRANEFVDAIRNGLLHDGETRRGWTIRQGTPTGPIVEDVGSGLIRLYRSAFHEALKDYVAAYFERLRAEDGVELRENLSNRIEQLCKDSVLSKQGGPLNTLVWAAHQDRGQPEPNDPLDQRRLRLATVVKKPSH